MRKVLFLRLLMAVLLSLWSCMAVAAGDLSSLAKQWNQLNTAVRDGAITKFEAQRGLQALSEELDRAGQEFFVNPSPWVFPLQGYTPSCMGRSSYQAKGYDFFSGNRHGGHPSEDLFVRETARNARDVRSGKPVTVLAMTDGIVVAYADDWQPGSRLRGGNYLWLYNPWEQALVYYAHNDRLLVSLGDVVTAGTPIATVGRSGLNAYKKRSPSHLHLTYLSLRDGYPRPVNIYKELRRSHVKVISGSN